jgi:GntR family transcriptional regulator, transcriptional repressor for pyruvate dehydrogenase complex
VEPTATVARTPAQEAVFQPVEPPTTFEETVERLGTAIRLGILAPGTRLPAERDLADQLRISRSTLRQALNTLVQSGHLVSFRGRAGGTFVAKDPPLGQNVDGEVLGEEARAVLDYRVAVETGATVLAAERARESDLNRLWGLTESMDVAQRFADPRRAEMSDLIARIAHPEEVLIRSNEQHRRLVALLRRRDVGGAVRLMREHMDGTEHILAGLLPERPW